MKQQLIEAIHNLADELLRNGKGKTADFFFTAESSVDSECGGNKGKLLDLLDQLQWSGSLIQYANFTSKEEELWDRVYELTKKWRATLD